MLKKCDEGGRETVRDRMSLRRQASSEKKRNKVWDLLIIKK